jgi:hypothetical protein
MLTEKMKFKNSTNKFSLYGLVKKFKGNCTSWPLLLKNFPWHSFVILGLLIFACFTFIMVYQTWGLLFAILLIAFASIYAIFIYKSIRKKLLKKWQVPEQPPVHWQRWIKMMHVYEYLEEHGLSTHEDIRIIIKDLEGRLNRLPQPFKLRWDWLVTLSTGIIVYLMTHQVAPAIKEHLSNSLVWLVLIVAILMIIAPVIYELTSGKRQLYISLIDTK